MSNELKLSKDELASAIASALAAAGLGGRKGVSRGEPQTFKVGDVDVTVVPTKTAGNPSISFGTARHYLSTWRRIEKMGDNPGLRAILDKIASMGV